MNQANEKIEEEKRLKGTPVIKIPTIKIDRNDPAIKRLLMKRDE